MYRKLPEREWKDKIKTLLEQLSYESTEVRVDVFNGEVTWM